MFDGLSDYELSLLMRALNTERNTIDVLRVRAMDAGNNGMLKEFDRQKMVVTRMYNLADLKLSQMTAERMGFK